MNPSPDAVRPDEIIAFWFDEAVKPLWFNSTPDFDNRIRQRYESLLQKALAGELDHWKQSAQGVLALVIILDQFALNMYRGEARSFAGEAKAREYAGYALQQDWDRDMTGEQRAFLYMPFMHSESLEDQDRSVALYEAAGLTENLKFALHHRDIVRRFGRFPHRNEILGRTSRPEEIEYLQSENAFHG